ncbi:MAG: BACON domain-containing carbohydrate-binding protein [Ktedonobacteraceae bacterium]
MHATTPAAFTPFTPEEQTWKGQGSITLPFMGDDPSFAEHTRAWNAASPLAPLGSSEHTALQLGEAARRIEDDKSSSKRLRRSGHLAPLRDISADIQRTSTPHQHQHTNKRRSGFDTQPDREVYLENVADPNATEFYPCHNQDATKEKERDLWANATDPFLARSRPNAAAAAQIEAADIQRVQLEERVTLPYPSIRSNRRRFSIWRLILGSVIILALSALLIDGLLLTLTFQPTPKVQDGPPTLTLSTDVASSGQTISVQLIHFKRLTSVVLTHDIQQTLLTTASPAALMVNADGQASASFTVSNSWGAGVHLIVAEDVATRDTASAQLQINNAGPLHSPHLLLDSTSVNLGSAVQDADTLQALTLRNTGSGSITWSASSNQSWLLVAPLQGTFGAGQTISLAAQRNHLQPGTYTGTITIASSVGDPTQLYVTMTVTLLPSDAGPMISLTPPLFSFTTVDDSAASVTQVLTLSNPGQQQLSWSLDSGKALTTTAQSTFLVVPRSNEIARQGFSGFDLSGDSMPWLSADVSSGSLAPGQSTQLHLSVRSQNLLPGTYMGLLTFSAAHNASAYDSPQLVGVALTVQPHCGLFASTGNLSFTAVTGQSNPSTHALTLHTTANCASDPLNWQALPSNNWITVSQTSGQVKDTASSITAIGVDTTNLTPGTYTGLVLFQAGKNTSTVTIQLDFQPRPTPLEPLMDASPLSLNFSTIQAQTNPGGQVFTITNNGGSLLKWHSTITTPDANWISISPSSGSVSPGSTGQITVNVATTSLAPGTYTGQIALNGSTTSNTLTEGSPQTLTVSLLVQSPCSLTQPSARSLVFNGVANSANPATQTIALAADGSCSWPLHWHTNVSPIAPWLTLTPSTGSLDPSVQGGTITVSANTSGLEAGTYSTSIKISATNAAGTPVQGSPQTFAVTLTIQQACTLQPLPAMLVFNAAHGASPASQTLTLNETGSCGGGVAWTASADPGSNVWLNLSAHSGLDTGNGSTIVVTVTPGNLTPNTYTGQITISASTNGVMLQGSPQVLNVTFVMTG